jgi:hypothetical protein
MKYRVHMLTGRCPGHAYYEGPIDVYAENPEQAIDRARSEAFRRAGHRGLEVRRVEVIGEWKEAASWNQ